MVDTRFHPSFGPTSISKLIDEADIIVAPLPPAELEVQVSGADELETAGKNDVALAASKKYLDALANTKAGVVVVGKEIADAVPSGIIALIADDPHLLFTRILYQLFPDNFRTGMQRLAADNATSELEDNVCLGANAYIGDGATIGAGSILGPNAVIGPSVTIGRNTIIGPNVSIEYAHVGDNVIVHAGARIGTDGFGWLGLGRANHKVPQLGRVIIQDNVEIGANTTIDRGALGDTTIGSGTKIDNLVQIGHNCQIGRNCLIAATSGISGSTIIEDSVLLGGGVGTAGHLKIGMGSIIHGRAAVTKDWPAGSKLMGTPARDAREYWRETVALRRLVKRSNN